MSFLNFKQNIKNLRRAKEIVTILAGFGLADIFERSKLSSFLQLKVQSIEKDASKDESLRSLNTAERARLALEKLGPTFIKFGQIISTRPDLIPEDFILEFSKLQNDVPSYPYAEVEQLIAKEFKKTIKELFSEFDEVPVAAASLSQVHKAKLKNSTVVAVKIQRPNIRATIETDINILYELAKFIEKRGDIWKIYKPAEIINEFSKTIKKELDFMNEGRNIDKFRANFSKDKTVHLPYVYWQLTTEKVLTMEFIEGTGLFEIVRSKENAYNKKLIAERYVTAIHRQIFEHGFFHADPHPGNVNILRDNIIAFLDLGMTGRIDESMMGSIADLLISTINSDAESIVNTLEVMDIITPETDIKVLTRELKDFVDKYYGLPIKDMHVGKIMMDIFEIIKKHEISFPSELALLVKALITAEGIVLTLDPDFNMVEHTRPFAENLVKQKYSPEKIFKKLGKTTTELLELFQQMPDELIWILRNLRKGEITVGIKHKGLEKFLIEIDRASNRLSFSIIIAAVIVGSSLIIQLNKGPFLFGYPIVGILGFMIAGILGLGLVFDIIWRGKLK